MQVIQFTEGAELPDRAVTWRASDGTVIPFATGYTFRLHIGTPEEAGIDKTTGITGADVAPNVTIAFTAAELDALPPGRHPALLWARRTSDSKDRDPMRLIIDVLDG